MEKIEIERICRPYMYNTYSDLSKIDYNNVLTIRFKMKNKFRVKKHYIGKEIKFVVNNFFEYELFNKPTKVLALIPIDKLENFKNDDILILISSKRIECLMIDLFPINRKPFAGWKNKTVEIISVE